MKPVWLIFLLLFGLGDGVASAMSLLIEVQPDRLGDFEIHSEQLPGGEIRFTVKISKPTFPSHVSTSLSMVKIGDRHAPSWSETVGPGRATPMKRQDNLVTCVFTVTEKEIADRDFCFVFSEQAEIMENGKLTPMPSMTMYYVRLKNFAGQ